MMLKFLKKNSLKSQIIKFSLIGGLNFLVDFIIYLFLTRIILLYFLLANVVSFLIANSLSFLLNKNFTFQDKNKNNLFIKYFKFLSLTVASVIISSCVLFVCVKYLRISDIYGKIIGTILGAIWNFTTYRLLVFKNKKSVNVI